MVITELVSCVECLLFIYMNWPILNSSVSHACSKSYNYCFISSVQRGSLFTPGNWVRGHRFSSPGLISSPQCLQRSQSILAAAPRSTRRSIIRTRGTRRPASQQPLSSILSLIRKAHKACRTCIARH